MKKVQLGIKIVKECIKTFTKIIMVILTNSKKNKLGKIFNG